jgi:hypothetical protein
LTTTIRRNHQLRFTRQEQKHPSVPETTHQKQQTENSNDTNQHSESIVSPGDDKKKRTLEQGDNFLEWKYALMEEGKSARLIMCQTEWTNPDLPRRKTGSIVVD